MHLKSLTVLFAALCACAPTVEGPPPVEPEPEPDVAPIPVSVDALLDSLSLRDKVAQVVMPWVAGSYAAFDDAALERAAGWVDSLHVGGIIVSVGSPLDIAAKLNYLQRRAELPLLIAADLESGTAIRFTGGTPFPPNMGVGATGRELDAYQVGRITALEARAVGIHLAFAPVADINNNPNNPIINTRSFGGDPELVAQLVTAAVRGLQEHGLRATVKHFPGHGDTDTDSHLSLPVIDADWARLDTLELVPFRAAVDADVAAVMSAHIALPALDGGLIRPSTVSPRLLTGILRDSLGFDGIIVTDALDMGALIKAYGAGDAAVLAFQAGADLLLQPDDPAEAIAALERAVLAGEISRRRLDRSVRKLLELKHDLGLFEHRTVSLDSIPAVVGRAEFDDIAREIAERSIVLVRDSLGYVDSLRERPRRLTLVAYGDAGHPGAGATLAAELRARGHDVTTFRLYPASGTASYDSARVALASRPYAVFAVAVRTSAWRGTIALPDSLAALIDGAALLQPTVLVSLGTPYAVSQTPHVGSYLIGWSSNPISERAVAGALSGAPITGTLPIAIPPGIPAGAGLQRPAPATSLR